jgi:hypothetical protein
MQYKAFEDGIEVNGQTVYSIVDGFSDFKFLATRFLRQENLGRNGVLKPDAWYSQAAWLRAFESIAREVGQAVLYQIGLVIPRNAKIPASSFPTIDAAIQAIDVGYHMNHRKKGVVMFDPATGTMLEGIGHYGFERPPGNKKEVLSVCNNPYPCAFDRGILTTFACFVHPSADVVHDDAEPCRNKGADSCSYIVRWR